MRLFGARRFGVVLLSVGLMLVGSMFSGCRAEQSWPLWEQYSARFIDVQGRVIDTAQTLTRFASASPAGPWNYRVV